MARFGVQVLGFNVDLTLLPMIANAAPHVERIYYAWSAAPFSAYNATARQSFPNPTPRSLIDRSPFRDKVTVIEGTWATEEECRNACLAAARADGMDYMIVQDADELYLGDDYRANLAAIEANPRVERFSTPWLTFWKNLNYVQEFRRDYAFGDPRLCGSPLFAARLTDGLKFTRQRTTNASGEMMMLRGTCFHLAYVYSDEDLLRKLKTWSHANQLQADRWFRRKWLAWTPRTRNLHPVTSVTVKRAVPYAGPWPQELQALGPLDQKLIPLPWQERLADAAADVATSLRINAGRWTRPFRRPGR
jgi:hypothetical protein